MASDASTTGTVYLVGAGPGDPGLITVRGAELLRRADVVVYDALAEPSLLALAPPGAERIDAGKRARKHRLTQDETHQLLVDLARQHRCVVRLKGGDPYLFGRGAEEASFLARHGIPCEVVCGITSGIAAPAAGGVPVTHRDFASSVTFLTGHEDPTKGTTQLDYGILGQLVRTGGTLCIYMGVGRLAEIAAALIEGGASPDTPVACVRWGTTPRQRQARARLDNAAEVVAAAGITAPAIVVVGRVAGIDEPGLDAFTNRPLFGQRVLVTRTRQQASALAAQLRDDGAAVLEAPTITLDPPESWASVDAVLRNLAGVDWLVLTSVNGVHALADRLDAIGRDARALSGVQLAAVGDATAQAMRDRLAVRPDLVPGDAMGDALADAMIRAGSLAGRRVVLLRADIARPSLPDRLQKAGAEVVELIAYHTRVADSLPPAVDEALRNGQLDWVTFTSASTARNLHQLLGPDATACLSRVKLASIGPITSAALRDLGLSPTVEAIEHDMPGLVAAIRAHT